MKIKSISTYAATLAVLVTASGLVLAADPPKGKIGLEKTVNNKIIKSKVPANTINVGGSVELNVVYLQRLPEGIISISKRPEMQIDRAASAPPGGISSAGATAYVSKRWLGDTNNKVSGPCSLSGAYEDIIDLSIPRKHGFLLHSYSINHIHPPTYGKVGVNLRETGGLFDQSGLQTQRYDQVSRIKIFSGNKTYGLKMAFNVPTPCFTGYRIDISLIGPADIHPFTGQKIVHSPVN